MWPSRLFGPKTWRAHERPTVGREVGGRGRPGRKRERRPWIRVRRDVATVGGPADGQARRGEVFVLSACCPRLFLEDVLTQRDGRRLVGLAVAGLGSRDGGTVEGAVLFRSAARGRVAATGSRNEKLERRVLFSELLHAGRRGGRTAAAGAGPPSAWDASTGAVYLSRRSAGAGTV